MRIGYPCLNLTIKNPNSSTFRLSSYTEGRLIETVKHNLKHLYRVLQFNVQNNITFFRISSDLIPFASHPICKYNWINHFKDDFIEIGNYIKRNNVRISMHPDQYVVLNSPHAKIIENGIKELQYHCNILNSLDLGHESKIQIHLGGVYGNKHQAIESFIKTYDKLDVDIKNRLVIENDDRSYSLSDCLDLSNRTGVPIVFDVFHHEILNNGESLKESILKSSKTWHIPTDGKPILDYSSQSKGERKGKHVNTIDYAHFMAFLKIVYEIKSSSPSFDVDIMLEIKDKENSALNALKLASSNILSK